MMIKLTNGLILVNYIILIGILLVNIKLWVIMIIIGLISIFMLTVVVIEVLFEDVFIKYRIRSSILFLFPVCIIIFINIYTIPIK